MGLAVMYVVHPFICDVFEQIPALARLITAAVLLILFIWDNIHTFHAILRENSDYRMVEDSLKELAVQFKGFQLYSLDEPLSWETAVTRGEWLAAPHGDFQNSVCFHDHLHRQGPDVCRMAYGLIGGDTVHEVRARCHWSRAHTRRVYHRLRQGMLEYMSI